MTLYDIKPYFQALLRPLARWAYERGATANAVTLAAAAGSLLLGFLLALAGGEHSSLFALLPVWLLLRMALNAMDGMLAREHDQQSVLGAYLNELCDVISDAALILPFAYAPRASAAQIVVITVLAGCSEFAGALGPMVGAPRRYDGPLGKSDRALLFGALGLWLGMTGELPSFFSWAQPAIIALLILTIVNRVRAGMASAKAS
ncbi:MAG: CDP-alcohol phosphatidyltransferase family protein [Methylocystis sp.]